MQHAFRKPLQTLTRPNPDHIPPTSRRPSGLQPHNFLLTSNGPDAKLKAADFGFSCFFQVKLLGVLPCMAACSRRMRQNCTL